MSSDVTGLGPPSQAVLRILGTGVAPFDDARRAVLASALQSDLADVAAGDVAILTARRRRNLACLLVMCVIACVHTHYVFVQLVVLQRHFAVQQCLLTDDLHPFSAGHEPVSCWGMW